MIQPIILCGGDGTRLWPASRKALPKQFMPLHNSTLFKQTILRTLSLSNSKAPLVVCNNEQRFLAASQIQEVWEQEKDINIGKPEILLEPQGKNTAPAIALAAIHYLSVDPLLLVLPSDHYIKDIDKFSLAIEEGVLAANSGSLVTFGIVPNRVETGYGYIGVGSKSTDGSYVVSEFLEKPSAEKAEQLIASGKYLWNSGMFLFKASAYLKELAKFSKEILDCCKESYEKRTTDLDFIRLDEDAFSKCPSDSIDYAVMEHTTAARVVPMEASWSDLGSWESLYSMEDVDANNNAFIGDVVIKDCENSFIVSQSRLVTGVGLKDMLVIETADAVMVAKKDQSQSIKELVSILKSSNRAEAEQHVRVYRPWGSYESLISGNRFQVKRIVVNPKQSLSLQKHFHRSEHWVVVRGTALVTLGQDERLLREDESVYIPLGTTHRLSNPGKVPLEIIEIQTGSYLGEDDIVRLEDNYGR